YNSLSEQNKDLRARLEAMSGTAAVPDLEPIKEKVARVGQLTQRVEAIGNQLDPLHQQVVQYGKKVDELDARVDELVKGASGEPDRRSIQRNREDSSSADDHPPAAEGERSDREPPATGNAAATGDSTLLSGIRQFREKRYREAY